MATAQGSEEGQVAGPQLMVNGVDPLREGAAREEPPQAKARAARPPLEGHAMTDRMVGSATSVDVNLEAVVSPSSSAGYESVPTRPASPQRPQSGQPHEAERTVAMEYSFSAIWWTAGCAMGCKTDGVPEIIAARQWTSGSGLRRVRVGYFNSPTTFRSPNTPRAARIPSRPAAAPSIATRSSAVADDANYKTEGFAELLLKAETSTSSVANKVAVAPNGKEISVTTSATANAGVRSGVVSGGYSSPPAPPQ